MRRTLISLLFLGTVSTTEAQEAEPWYRLYSWGVHPPNSRWDLDLERPFRDAISLWPPHFEFHSCWAPEPEPLPSTLFIMDDQGALVRQQRIAAGERLDTSDLPPGVYWLYLGNGPLSLVDSQLLVVKE